MGCRPRHWRSSSGAARGRPMAPCRPPAGRPHAPAPHPGVASPVESRSRTATPAQRRADGSSRQAQSAAHRRPGRLRPPSPRPGRPRRDAPRRGGRDARRRHLRGRDSPVGRARRGRRRTRPGQARRRQNRPTSCTFPARSRAAISSTATCPQRRANSWRPPSMRSSTVTSAPLGTTTLPSGRSPPRYGPPPLSTSWPRACAGSRRRRPCPTGTGSPSSSTPTPTRPRPCSQGPATPPPTGSCSARPVRCSTSADSRRSGRPVSAGPSHCEILGASFPGATGPPRGATFIIAERGVAAVRPASTTVCCSAEDTIRSFIKNIGRSRSKTANRQLASPTALFTSSLAGRRHRPGRLAASLLLLRSRSRAVGRGWAGACVLSLVPPAGRPEDAVKL